MPILPLTKIRTVTESVTKKSIYIIINVKITKFGTYSGQQVIISLNKGLWRNFNL